MGNDNDVQDVANVASAASGSPVYSSDECVCGNKFMDDSIYCRKCGQARPQDGLNISRNSATKTPTPATPTKHIVEKKSLMSLGNAGKRIDVLGKQGLTGFYEGRCQR